MTDDRRITDFENEFKAYRGQKSRRVGGVERRVLQNLAMYVGEQWVWFEGGSLNNRDPKRDDSGKITEVNLVFNKIQPTQEKIYGRLTASTPQFQAFPDDRAPEKIAKAEVVTNAIRAQDERLDEDYLRWQRWFWMMLGGVAFEHTPWRRNLEVGVDEKDDENGEPLWRHLPTDEEISNAAFIAATQGEGENPPVALPEHFKRATEVTQIGDFTSEILGPLNVFLPNSIRTIADLAPGQSIMLPQVRLLDWAKKTWPEADFSEVEPEDSVDILTTKISEKVSFSNTSLRDLIPVIQGSMGEDDPDMVTIIERYEPVSDEFPPGWSTRPDADTGPGFVASEEETFQNGGRYTVFIPGQAILRDGEIPYEDGIPVQDFHWNVSAANMWSTDWQTRLNGPQKSINTLVSQIRMISNARIFDPVLMEDDMTPPETDNPRYWAGAWEDGAPKAGRLNADRLPSGFQQQLQFLMETFDDLAGGKDLSDDPAFPGQIRGTGAVSMLQDVMDSQWGPKLRHYYRQMSKVYHRRINRMKQFYPPSRTLRMTDSSGKVEVFEFHSDEILRAGVDFFVSVEPSTILPESRRERYSRMEQMLSGPLSGLYLNQQTGQFDWNAIATELQFGDYKGREAFVAQDEKFANMVISAIKEGKPAPPVMQIQNHAVFIKELISEMNDQNFWETLSEPTQQAIFQRYQQHAQIMQEAQQAQQEAIVTKQTMGIVREAVQQSVAQVTSQTTQSVLTQLQEMGNSSPQALAALLGSGPSEPV